MNNFIHNTEQLMIVKLLEIRDRGTFIPVMAIKLRAETAEAHWLLSRAGFGLFRGAEKRYVFLTRLEGSTKATYDPFEWDLSSRTMQIAHINILKNFDSLKDGDVIDVEYILGETKEIKKSERFEAI